MGGAYRETTPTRERVCINGLWRWQPAGAGSEAVPTENWGYFKVPGPWPGTRFGRANESQTAYAHPTWRDADLSTVAQAWYQREVIVPAEWAGRRVFVDAQYVNASAVVFVDGKKGGEIRSRGGKVEVTGLCVPGQTQLLSILVRRGPRAFRGLCGDVFLEGVPAGERIGDVRVETSVRQWRIGFDTAVSSLAEGKRYRLTGEVLDGGEVVTRISSAPFGAQDLRNGRITFSDHWRPEKLWDAVTPQNQYELKLRLLDGSGELLDEFCALRFGFREFWVDGRDLRLNGTRIHFFATPLDVGEVSAYAASYGGARKMFSRLNAVGINLMYTHNYSCQPGAHISFEEILRAADDTGMLVSFTQPEFGDYRWDSPDAEKTNGYAEDAAFYVRCAQNHPSVVMYSTSHNATGTAQQQNPDYIDGKSAPWPDPQDKSRRTDVAAVRALRAEAIVTGLDPSRPLYHHSSGNLGQFYTLNCYLNFVPIQERSDWFGHWATEGVKPLLLVEYGAPYTPTWSDNRPGSVSTRRRARQFPAEWGAQFRGDAAYKLSQEEMRNPNATVKSSENIAGVLAMFIGRNWPAFRTWGVTMLNDWNLHYTVFTARQGALDPPITVDWDNLQKPGYSADFIRTRKWDHAYQDSDWTPDLEGEALIRYNRPVLAYVAGKRASFTSQDHNFTPGETVEKQVIVINNSREKVSCSYAWSLGLPEPVEGSGQVTVETGEQARVPVRVTLPRDLKPGRYDLAMTAGFSTGETQNDVFTINVLPEPPRPEVVSRVAVLDTKGETMRLLSRMGVRYRSVGPDVDLADYDVLIIGKHALTLANPIPDLSRVRAGLKVLVFEQSNEVLQNRLGFRTEEYCLRRAFPRASDHPALAGLSDENLRDWCGEGTTVPPRLEAPMDDYNKYPLVQWCGFTVPRAWRAGCQGSVASVLIEKPASGDFLPLIDGGFSLQYATLLEHREGAGMVLFCQMDVTGRTEEDPAAQRLAGNLLSYVSGWKPAVQRRLRYAGDPAGKAHLEAAGFGPAPADPATLAANDVLVVGPGGAAELAPHAPRIREWLGTGGRLLALGQDADDANSFLPLKLATERLRYTVGDLTPPSADGPFAGIGPADLYNREPRELPLISSGAAAVAQGVLAAARPVGDGEVVFCQLVPWQFDHEASYNVKPTFQRTSFALTRLLANMGVRPDTPLIENLCKPLPASAMLEDLPNVVWLQAGDEQLVLPEVWKGLPLGDAEPPGGWEAPAYDDSGWRNIKVPGVWENQFPDLANLNGLFLYRLTFDVPPDLAGQEVTLVLGAVDDEDWTYVNGQFVGSLTRQTNPNDYYSAVRSYTLPQGLLKPGRNTIAVKVNDLRQAGGLLASLLKRRGGTAERWLSGLYVDKPEAQDDPYRYYCW
jgi:hypothetical protein